MGNDKERISLRADDILDAAEEVEQLGAEDIITKEKRQNSGDYFKFTSGENLQIEMTHKFESYRSVIRALDQACKGKEYLPGHEEKLEKIALNVRVQILVRLAQLESQGLVTLDYIVEKCLPLFPLEMDKKEKIFRIKNVFTDIAADWDIL